MGEGTRVANIQGKKCVCVCVCVCVEIAVCGTDLVRQFSPNLSTSTTGELPSTADQPSAR